MYPASSIVSIGSIFLRIDGWSPDWVAAF